MESFIASTLNYISQPGFAWIVGVKTLGYLGFLAVGPFRGRSLGLIGLGAVLRMLIGILGGLALLAVGRELHPHFVIVFGVFSMVRFAEWRLLFFSFRRSISERNPWVDSVYGTGVSFLLDLPAALGWFGIQGGPF